MKTFVCGALLCFFATGVGHADPTCQSLFGDNWTEADDALVTSMANDFLAKVDPFRHLIVCEGVDEKYRYAMNVTYSVININGGEIPMMAIAIESRLRAVLPERQLRAVIAHEVAHYASGEGRFCPMYDVLRDRTLCESRVDKDAARLTNKEDMLVMLEFFVRPEQSPQPNKVFMEETLFRIKELKEWAPP